MIENFYEVDKDGNITAHFKLNTKQEKPRSWWIKGDIENMVEPRYIDGEWVDKKDESFKVFSVNKTEEMRNKCSLEITKGFDYEILGKEYHFSYGQENQINFQDTDRLFLNDNVTEIHWNAYIKREKVRILLNKDEFFSVYLEGVKHKQDCLNHLYEVILPQIEKAESQEDLNKIVWGETKRGFQTVTNNNIGTTVKNLSEDSVAQKSINEQMEGIVLEIADIAISAGL